MVMYGRLDQMFKMLIHSVGGMAMLRKQLARRPKRFVCAVNSHCARIYSTSIKTFNDIPSLQGKWPFIGHGHLFGPTGLYYNLLVCVPKQLWRAHRVANMMGQNYIF